MRRLAIWMLLAALTGPCWAVDQSVDELKARVEHARPEERPGLCIRIAEHQLRSADKLYADGNIEQARAAVEDIVAYSEKAGTAATQSRTHLKNVEIALRKISEKLRDIKRTLNFEDQAPVDRATQRLEDIRTTLLKEMFKKEKK